MRCKKAAEFPIASTDDCVDLLERLDRLEDFLTELLEVTPPLGWKRTDLEGLKWIVATLYPRLLTDASSEVRRAFHERMASIQRQGL